VGFRLEQRLPSPRLVSACRLGAAPGLVSPARLGSTAGVGRTVCRTTFRSVPPAALRVNRASEPAPGFGQAQAGGAGFVGWRQRGEIRSIATSWGATARLICPAPVVSVCDHRSRTV
jgi:hypothetical protein